MLSQPHNLEAEVRNKSAEFRERFENEARHFLPDVNAHHCENICAAGDSAFLKDCV